MTTTCSALKFRVEGSGRLRDPKAQDRSLYRFKAETCAPLDSDVDRASSVHLKIWNEKVVLFDSRVFHVSDLEAAAVALQIITGLLSQTNAPTQSEG